MGKAWGVRNARPAIKSAPENVQLSFFGLSKDFRGYKFDLSGNLLSLYSSEIATRYALHAGILSWFPPLVRIAIRSVFGVQSGSRAYSRARSPL
jgi:hypothetical protein